MVVPEQFQRAVGSRVPGVADEIRYERDGFTIRINVRHEAEAVVRSIERRAREGKIQVADERARAWRRMNNERMFG